MNEDSRHDPTATTPDGLITHQAACERIRSEPIAIIGMACRFPGSANNPEAYWQLLQDGREAIREIPPDRWDVESYYDPDLMPGTMNTRWSGLLDQVDQFDARFFGISPGEAAAMDPQQRLVLEIVWEALENAGLAPDRLAGSSTGVYIGACLSDYFQLLKGAPGRAATGVIFAILANRVSHVLDLNGPSFAVDSACSSSLLSPHLACTALRTGECDLALAGGVNMILRPETTIGFAQAGMMAPDGRCKPFDISANGYVRGEGCGMLVLKRWSDATRDRNRILALIRGSAVNHDGRAKSLPVPKREAQIALIRKALANAGLEPDQVSYIEAHSAGTVLGDATELDALTEIFGDRNPSSGPCVIGSVKSNIGHLEAAAGAAGLIKTVLCLRHERIPRILHFNQINPTVDLDQFPFVIATEPQPWPAGDRTRCVGISGFSIGGANVHMILQEAPKDAAGDCGRVARRPRHLLALSARTPGALKQLAADYTDHLARRPDLSIVDVCHTANAGRSHFSHRLCLQAADLSELMQELGDYVEGAGAASPRLPAAPAGGRPRIAFLFPGQGSACPGMGRQLYDTQPTFRRIIDQCGRLLGEDLSDALPSVLFPATCTSAPPVDRPDHVGPATFALGFALANLLMEWGIRPQAVLGHGVGKLVASCVAGTMKLEDALPLSMEQGQSDPSRSPSESIMSDTHEARSHDCISDGIDMLTGNGFNLLLEMGPIRPPASQSTTDTYARMCLLGHGEEDWRGLLDAVAMAYRRGVDVDWPSFDRDCPAETIDLPTYPFQRKLCWLPAEEIDGPERGGSTRRHGGRNPPEPQ